MSIALFQAQHRSAYLSLINSLTFHRLVKINKMSIKLRSVYAGKFDLVAYSDTTGTTHTGSIYHDRVQTDNRRNLQFFRQQADKFHHDHRSDCNTDIVLASLFFN